MPKRVVAGPNAEGLPLSEAVEAGGFLFLSGLVGLNPDGTVVPGGVGAELDAIFAQAVELLGRAGGTLDDVVKVTVHLVDGSDFAAFNDRYRGHFPHSAPARICTVSSLTIDARLELDMIACIER